MKNSEPQNREQSPKSWNSKGSCVCIKYIFHMYFTVHLSHVMSWDQAIKITVPTNVGSWPPLHQKNNSAFRERTEFKQTWARRGGISQAERWVGGDVVKVLTGMQELCPRLAWRFGDTSCTRVFGRPHDPFGEVSSYSDVTGTGAGAGREWRYRQQCRKSPSCTS